MIYRALERFFMFRLTLSYTVAKTTKFILSFLFFFNFWLIFNFLFSLNFFFNLLSVYSDLLIKFITTLSRRIFKVNFICLYTLIKMNNIYCLRACWDWLKLIVKIMNEFYSLIILLGIILYIYIFIKLNIFILILIISSNFLSFNSLIHNNLHMIK